MTMTAEKQDELARAKQQAFAQYQHIEQLIERLQAAEEQAEEGPDETEAPRTEIEESPLSIMVRDGWRIPGQPSQGPEEYEILLSTGGPAVRIVGELTDYNEPETARMEYQDWFTPWTRWDCTEEQRSYLLRFAQCFYFGE